MKFSVVSGGECVMETSYTNNINDDFDAYFKRAAQLQLEPQLQHLTTPVHHQHQQQQQQQAGPGRRDSAPGRRSSSTERRRSGSGSGSVRHKRTSSCRYPQRRPIVTVTHEQSAAPSEHTPLTAACHQSPANDHRQLSARSSTDAQRLSAPVHCCTSRSAPHSRSSSWKKVKRPPSVSADLDKRRTSSSVSFEDAISAKLLELKLLQAEDCVVVRQFDTSPKGALVNRGDSIKRRRRRQCDDSSPMKSSSSRSPDKTSYINDGSQRPTETASSRAVRVVVLGDDEVGKTALLQQFMTSVYMAAAVQTHFDYECEKTVSVLLDNSETILDFVELKNRTYDDVSEYGPVGAIILVYSITSQQSFEFVVNQLRDMRDVADRTPVVVVANKTDLVRTRQVSEDAGREICRGWCRYCEVSAALNHRVDELLVDIVTAVRQTSSRRRAECATTDAGTQQASAGDDPALPAAAATCRQDPSDTSCVRSAAIMLKGLFTKQKSPPASKSCENLID